MDHDKSIRRFSALFATVWLVFVATGISVLVFLGWVVVALLQHFGVV